MVGDLRITRSYQTPAGWLPCDARTVKRADYPDLLAALTFHLQVTFTAGSPVGYASPADPNLPNVPQRRGCMVESPNLPNNSQTAGQNSVNPVTGAIAFNVPANASGTFDVWFFPDGDGQGVGDGFTTFNLPDCTGRGLWGSGQARAGNQFDPTSYYAPADSGGFETVPLMVQHLPSHAHTFGFRQVASGGLASGTVYNFTADPDVTTDPTGGDQQHENRSPFYGVRVLIQAVPGAVWPA